MGPQLLVLIISINRKREIRSCMENKVGEAGAGIASPATIFDIHTSK